MAVLLCVNKAERKDPVSDTCRNDVPIDQGVCLSGVWGLCLFTRATHVLLAALSLLCFILQLITQTTLT